MAKPDLTRKHIAATFKALLEEHPYNAITVQSVIEHAEVNRKTFYYHFYNKPDLVIYIFRCELAEVLRKTFPADELICDTEVATDKYREMPFFVKNSLDEYDRSAFFLELSNYFKRNDVYYRKLSRGEDWAFFENYVGQIYMPQLLKTVAACFEEFDVEAPQDDMEYIAAYYTHSTVHWLLHRHTTKRKHYTDETKRHLSNLFYENIRNTVEKQVERIRMEGETLPTTPPPARNEPPKMRRGRKGAALLLLPVPSAARPAQPAHPAQPA